jgi:hypothetical protein
MTQQELIAEIKRLGQQKRGDGNYEKYRDLKQQLWEAQNVTQHEKIDVGIDIGTKYHRMIKGSLISVVSETLNTPTTVQVDIYDVLKAFEITCPARQHAIKKLLLAGGRGSKSERTDLEEAGNSIKRATELLC